MTTDTRLADAFARLPDYLGSHVLVSITALAIGLGISLPLAIASRQHPVLRGALLAVASVFQTIPGLALLALFYPMLLALAGLSERLFGKSFSALGFLPSVLALALYSMLPVLRNTVVGLNGIAPSLREAARLFGATPGRLMRDIELPLAMPVIMAGIRTSAVWVIGTATLSTPIGQTSLGNYIFAGLQTQNWVFVLFGCVAAAALALVVDQLLALMERGVAARSRKMIMAGGAGLVLVVLAALLPGHGRAQATYVIGAKPFTEQYVLAALIEQRLAAHGLSAQRRDGLGSGVIFNALVAGDIDAYVDYSGTLLGQPDAPQRREAARGRAGRGFALARDHARHPHAGRARLRERLCAGDAARARRKARHPLDRRSGVPCAAAFHRRRLRILRAPGMEGDPRRPMALHFRQQRTMQSDFMYQAARAGDVDVVSAYTSDGRIAQFDLAVLDDPKHAIPPYDAILLLAPKRAHDEALIAALKPLIGAIPVAAMRAANARAADGGTTADDVARWLDQQISAKAPR